MDYQYIAIEISAYALATIEFHLFYNVAPVCSANLEQVIPPIWAGFDKAALIHDIYEQGIQSASQITLKRKLAAKLYKFKYRKEWESLNVFLNNKSI